MVIFGPEPLQVRDDQIQSSIKGAIIDPGEGLRKEGFSKQVVRVQGEDPICTGCAHTCIAGICQAAVAFLDYPDLPIRQRRVLFGKIAGRCG